MEVLERFNNLAPHVYLDGWLRLRWNEWEEIDAEGRAKRAPVAPEKTVCSLLLTLFLYLPFCVSDF